MESRLPSDASDALTAFLDLDEMRKGGEGEGEEDMDIAETEGGGFYTARCCSHGSARYQRDLKKDPSSNFFVPLGEEDKYVREL